MKIVITGGSGFIGTYLMGSLLRAGHDVTIFDKRPSAIFQDRYVFGDVRDIDSFSAALEGVEVVYHLAAEHADNVRPIRLYYDVNVGGAKNLVEIATKKKIQKIIFTSTVAVYGLNVGIPDETSTANPFNDYGKSKADAEQVLKEWAKLDVNNTLAILRPVVVFGENNRGNVYNLLKQIASRHFLMISRGHNKKSMAYVHNIVLFMIEIMKLKHGIHIFNYADKPDLTTNEIIDIVFKYLNKKQQRFYIPFSVGLLAGYCFDMFSFITRKRLPISSIRIKKFCADTVVSAKKLEEMGFKAPYTLIEGLNRMLKNEFGNHI